LQYKTLGKTGLKASILGFGVLRLPQTQTKRPTVDRKETIRIIRHAIDNGLNYVDTAYNYVGSQSEKILGGALQDGYREKVIISTKSPLWDVKSKKIFHSLFEDLFHNVNQKRYKDVIEKFGLIDEMKKLKEAGKIKHFGFSSHSEPKFVKSLIELDEFEVILLQYNFLDRETAEVYKYAKEKDLGTLRDETMAYKRSE